MAVLLAFCSTRLVAAHAHSMYLTYSLLLAAAMLAALPYFAVQGLRHGKYWPNLLQRLGRLPEGLAERSAQAPGALWIHAVSVGEVAAAAALARRLRERLPGRRLVVSTTTITGQQMARERIGWADDIFYFPFDWAWVVRRFFRGVRPAMVIILEAELWPNFLRVAGENGVPVIFASARISERSFRRYRCARGFFRRATEPASAFIAQTEEDARRIETLVARPERVRVGGNLKFDAPAPARNPLADWLAAEAGKAGRAPVVVAGSVVANEEEAVLDAFAGVRARHPNALLALAPRKPERFDAAAELAAARGWGVARRSRIRLDQPLESGAGILLIDTIGELGGVYGVADLVFVGGSLVAAGGHNILEPAALGKAPIFGPHMENFREIAEKFLASGAAAQVTSGSELGRLWLDWLEHSDQRNAAGQAARELVERNRGAAERVVEMAEALLGASERR